MNRNDFTSKEWIIQKMEKRNRQSPVHQDCASQVCNLHVEKAVYAIPKSLMWFKVQKDSKVCSCSGHHLKVWKSNGTNSFISSSIKFYISIKSDWSYLLWKPKSNQTQTDRSLQLDNVAAFVETIDLAIWKQANTWRINAFQEILSFK